MYILSIEYDKDRVTENKELTFNTRAELDEYIDRHGDREAEYWVTIKPSMIWIELSNLPFFVK